eukprot:CAMPEP_0194506932 /NCGR_PEP_ID=MMETSP0253-20130528/35584_1 /TAXON_ID=2966 /ORGANISM="Noctiluca scintillans" /LENGTH=173 /DNA_ID=CAMNT_0039349729 /DNA_START=35 /DNA_END=556 /DNA_ORIENTATION=-
MAGRRHSEPGSFSPSVGVAGFVQSLLRRQSAPTPPSGDNAGARPSRAPLRPVMQEPATPNIPPSGWVVPNANSPRRRQSAPTSAVAPEGSIETPKFEGSRSHHRRRSAPATSEEETCVICFEAPGGVVLQPCGHDQFCRACAKQVRKCPLCRASMSSWQDGRTLCVFGTPIWV